LVPDQLRAERRQRAHARPRHAARR